MLEDLTLLEVSHSRIATFECNAGIRQVSLIVGVSYNKALEELILFATLCTCPL